MIHALPLLISLMLFPLVDLQAVEPPRPNIIFILADDFGIGNCSCYGADNFSTPNLDRLARSGILFTRAFTAPLCGPSRALVMTGRYAFRTGATNQDRVGRLSPSVETMLPKVLSRAGYVCSAVGKWSQFPLQPSDWGFDDYLRFKGSGVYRSNQTKSEVYIENGEIKILRETEYLPDLMHNHVVEFIRTHHDEPFFVYYSLSHVHADLLPTPDSSSNSDDLFKDNVAYMDKLIGKLVSELDHLKLRDNTLIVFMGDNGTGKSQASRSTIRGRRLAGEKGTMLEGGSLVPLIANWVGVTPGGNVVSDLIDSSDFLPTFAQLAGAELPQRATLDGHSFAAQLRGEKKRESRDWIFVELARKWYVREAGWKLNQDGELFDMSDAPFDALLVSIDSTARGSTAARRRLQAVLDELNPAGGILDDGDGTGRHAKKRRTSPQATPGSAQRQKVKRQKVK